MSEVVETYWIPAPFTIGWKITRPNHRIRFEKGESGRAGAIKYFREDPELEHDYNYARNMHNFVDQVKTMRQREGKSDEIQKERALRFQTGEMPDGARIFDAHKKRVKLRPFARPEKKSHNE